MLPYNKKNHALTSKYFRTHFLKGNLNTSRNLVCLQKSINTPK